MTDTIPEGRPDTSDMIAVHNVFRAELGAAAGRVTASDPGDADRIALLATHYENVLAFLQVHHEGEDALLWPKLVERAPGHAARVSEIAAQHHDVDHALASSRAALSAWKAAPEHAAASAVGDALASLHTGLSAHLAQEEAEIVPLAAEYLTIPEWGEFPAHGMQHFTGDKIWLLLGLLREQMTEEQKATMLAMMPPPVVDFWVNAGEPQYVVFIAQVRA